MVCIPNDFLPSPVEDTRTVFNFFFQFLAKHVVVFAQLHIDGKNEGIRKFFILSFAFRRM